ncbi:MAG TPA: type III polyketide synthase [Acidobacteria bacterium]|nr:type III polyketide synthase [Acidobacteriota bacterium]
MRVAAVGRALPPHFYDQDILLQALSERWGTRFFNPERLERLHKSLLIGGRHLALPLEEYAGLTTWGKANDAWIRVAQEIGGPAVLEALRRAGLAPQDVDALFFVSVTGIATPSIDARLIEPLGLPLHLKRVPIFGLGCVAGAAGLARAADYVRGFPDQVAVLLSVELCSLTLQQEDLSIPNLIASGLFGDGAAAVVVVGEDRAEPGPRVAATRSVFYPGSERALGWDISETGFKIVLSAEVPDLARRFLGGDVDAFLATQGLTRADIASWICHPGGPKVLEAMQEALEITEEDLAVTWTSLRQVGNLSSASVLHILGEILDEHRPPPGSWGLLIAMGPGFCSELVLLQW